MKKSLVYSYIGLVVLTLLVALLASGQLSKMIVTVIVVLSLLKFWLVGFEFMELKKAHSFWKVLLLGFGVLIGFLFVVLL
ncbi:MAG: cytochrome C oxidase subunit IV family protein [Flavobacteriaceae bacterium]